MGIKRVPPFPHKLSYIQFRQILSIVLPYVRRPFILLLLYELANIFLFHFSFLVHFYAKAFLKKKHTHYLFQQGSENGDDIRPIRIKFCLEKGQKI